MFLRRAKRGLNLGTGLNRTTEGGVIVLPLQEQSVTYFHGSESATYRIRAAIPGQYDLLAHKTDLASRC